MVIEAAPTTPSAALRPATGCGAWPLPSGHAFPAQTHHPRAVLCTLSAPLGGRRCGRWTGPHRIRTSGLRMRSTRREVNSLPQHPRARWINSARSISRARVSLFLEPLRRATRRPIPRNHSIAPWAFHPRNAAVSHIPYDSNFGNARLVTQRKTIKMTFDVFLTDVERGEAL
jgi:hypothetical protein